MSAQSAIDFLTFTTCGRPVKVDPDIYYQIFNVRPSQRSKYAGNIIGVRMTDHNYPIVDFKSSHHKSMMLSRFIMNPPEEMIVDHISGDRLDNRRENLRIVTPRQNALNRYSKSNTGFLGVSSCKGKKGRRVCKAQYNRGNDKFLYFYALDCHENRILAAYARDKFVLQSGDEEYAPLNFDSFKYEPFRSFLLETDLNQFKLKSIPCPAPI